MIAFSLRKFFWGLMIIAIGGLFWARNYGLINFSFQFSRDWPVFIITIGLMGVWKALFGQHWWPKKEKDRNDNIPPKARKILEDLERGDISAEDAAKRMDD